MMTRLRANSRAASVPKEDAMVTEVVNGLIISSLWNEKRQRTPNQRP